MNDKPTMTKAQFVKAAMDYSLNWETDISREVKDALPVFDRKPQGLRDVLNAVGQYNNFTPSDLEAFLVANGANLMSVKLGRESSPCLYVSMPCWTQQMLGSVPFTGSEPLTQEFQQSAALEVLLSLMNSKTPPDELSVEEDCLNNKPRVFVTGPASAREAVKGRKMVTIRAWWD